MEIRRRMTLIVVMTVIVFTGLVLLSNTASANDDGDVIEIRTADDLYNVRNDLTANYKLMNDIDLSEVTANGGIYDYEGRGWSPIGSDDIYSNQSKFTGVFDGNRHEISGLRINVYSNKPSGTGLDVYAGLFANNAGVIKDLKIVDSTLFAETDGGSRNKYDHSYVAPIAAANEGTIQNCSTEAVCTAKSSSSYYWNGTFDAGYASAAGICATNSGLIDSCYSKSKLSAKTDSKDGWCGGIALNGGDSTISNCFALNTTLGGAETIKTSYYYSVKGDSITCTCFDDNGKKSTLNGTQMLNKNFYSGFDFDDVWVISSATDYKYPQLRNNMMDANKHVDTLEWKSEPSKVAYYTDEEIDPTGGVFTAYYIDDTHEDIEVTKDMLSGYDMSQLGMQTVDVTFREGSLTYDILTSERPQVRSMTLESMPNKTEFVRGTAFDFTGATAKVEYVNGHSDIIPISAEETTGGDITKSGTYTITFEKYGKSVDFEVKVVPVKPVSLNIVSPPEKTRYVEGQSIDVKGLDVKLEYNNGNLETVKDYAIQEYETTVGSRNITLSYDGFTASFPVEFVPKTLTGILVTTQPIKARYIVGEEFDASGMVVMAAYDNGLAEEITDYTVSELTNVVGWQTLEISYNGKKTSIKVYVQERELVSIGVKEMPLKQEYIEGEDFDSEGMVITANYNNSLYEEITDYTLTGTNLTKAGEKTITVLYEGFTTTFKVNVIAKTLLRIAVTPPTKLDYVSNEEFDPAGMVVKASYDNGKTETVTDYSISGFAEDVDNEDDLVTVSYGNKSVSFIVKLHTPENEMTVTEDATCTETGTKVLYCKNCHKELKTETIDAKGHDYKDIEGSEVEAKCTTDGKEVDQKCSRCNDVKAGKKIDALGHNMTEHKAVAEKCEEAGSSAYWSCDRCNKFFSDKNGNTAIEENSWVIEAKGHKWDGGEITTNPTCDSDGVKTFTCTVDGCGATRNETVGKTGHDYSKAWATDDDYHWHRCTHNNCTSKDSYGEHDWIENVTKYPTCTQTGIAIYTCSICEKTKQEVLKKTAHQWDELYTVDKPATCTEDGEKSIHCTDCTATKDETIIPKMGHSWGRVTYTWATDNSSVVAERVCENDPSHIEKETIKTTSQVTKAATYTAMGQTTYKAVFSDDAFDTQTKTVTNIPKLPKKPQPMVVKTSAKNVKVKKLKKKNLTIAPIRVANAIGTVSYKVVGGKAKSKKVLKINAKTGKATIKKKTKKGIYKIKVRVTAAGNSKYISGNKVVTVTVKVQ